MISELIGLANNSGYRIKHAEVFVETLFHLNLISGSATNKTAPNKGNIKKKTFYVVLKNLYALKKRLKYLMKILYKIMHFPHNFIHIFMQLNHYFQESLQCIFQDN